MQHIATKLSTPLDKTPLDKTNKEEKSLKNMRQLAKKLIGSSSKCTLNVDVINFMGGGGDACECDDVFTFHMSDAKKIVSYHEFMELS